MLLKTQNIRQTGTPTYAYDAITEFHIMLQKYNNYWSTLIDFFFNRIKIVYVSDDFKLFTANILGKYSEYRDTQLLAKSLSMDLYDMIQWLQTHLSGLTRFYGTMSVRTIHKCALEPLQLAGCSQN